MGIGQKHADSFEVAFDHPLGNVGELGELSELEYAFHQFHLADEKVTRPSIDACELNVDIDLDIDLGNPAERTDIAQKTQVNVYPVHQHTSLTGLSCPHCGRRDTIILEDGNYTCHECHTVVQRFLDHSAEWRYYGADDSNKTSDPARCGPPVNELLPSLGGSIMTISSTRVGGGCPGRHRRWSNTLSYRERSLYLVCDQLNTCAIKHGIPPSIVDTAKCMYKRVSEKKIFRGDNRQASVAACLYLACALNKVHRSIKEVSDMFGVREQCVTRVYKHVQDLLELSVASSTPVDFVNRFCSQLDLSEEFACVCKTIVLVAYEQDILSAYTPPSAVAGCIMLCAESMNMVASSIFKRRVSKVCQVSAVTINKCISAIQGPLHEIIGHAGIVSPPRKVKNEPSSSPKKRSTNSIHHITQKSWHGLSEKQRLGLGFAHHELRDHNGGRHPNKPWD